MKKLSEENKTLTQMLKAPDARPPARLPTRKDSPKNLAKKQRVPFIKCQSSIHNHIEVIISLQISG